MANAQANPKMVANSVTDSRNPVRSKQSYCCVERTCKDCPENTHREDEDRTIHHFNWWQQWCLFKAVSNHHQNCTSGYLCSFIWVAVTCHMWRVCHRFVLLVSVINKNVTKYVSFQPWYCAWCLGSKHQLTPQEYNAEHFFLWFVLSAPHVPNVAAQGWTIYVLQIIRHSLLLCVFEQV